MKIYEIGTGYTPIPAKMGAATEIVVGELTEALQKQGHDVSIVDIKATNRTHNDLSIIEVPVIKLFTGTDVQLGIMHKLKRVIYSINLARTLRTLIKKSKEKVVIHFHNQYNMYFFLKLSSKNIRKKCYIAYTNHSYIWHGEWREIKKIVQRRYFQEVYSMKNADRVYVLNKKTVKTLIENIGIAKDKVQLIDNGVNIDIYKPISENSIASIKEKIGFTGKRVFLQVGSVCDRKNQLGAIQLLLPLLKENPDVIFLYAGGIISENYQREIIHFTEQNGIKNQIVYLGELDPGKELNNYYNIAEVMVFPSKLEGFSLVVLEAMSAGVPVIINENLQFKLSEECLKYNNEEDFLTIIREQILDRGKQKELAIKARKEVITNYSWNKIASDYYSKWV